MDAILRALGYAPTFRYEKYRAVWRGGPGHVVLDETPIGVFGEIEGPARWIDRTARALGITPADYITQTYADLFFAWKRKTGQRRRGNDVSGDTPKKSSTTSPPRDSVRNTATAKGAKLPEDKKIPPGSGIALRCGSPSGRTGHGRG